MNKTICGLPSGSRILPLQDCSAWGLACFYYAICCTLPRVRARRIR